MSVPDVPQIYCRIHNKSLGVGLQKVDYVTVLVIQIPINMLQLSTIIRIMITGIVFIVEKVAIGNSGVLKM